MGGLEDHHVGGAGVQRERRVGRSGVGQQCEVRVGWRSSEVPTFRSGVRVLVNFADLQRYGIVVRVLGSDGDAGDGVAVCFAAGGEGLAVITVVRGINVRGLELIGDQGHRRVGGVLAVGHGRQDERRQGD